MTKFRWTTKAVAGPWLHSHNEALLSAVQYGQGSINEGKGSIVSLSRFASIEQSAA